MKKTYVLSVELILLTQVVQRDWKTRYFKIKGEVNTSPFILFIQHCISKKFSNNAMVILLLL